MPVNWEDPKVIEAVRQACVESVQKTTNDVRNEALRLITQGGKSGRWYRRRDRWHRASAPGEAPATDYGNLVRNIRATFEDDNLTGIVNSGAEYSKALEFGTRRMEPRPFMRVSLESQRKPFMDDVYRKIRERLAQL